MKAKIIRCIVAGLLVLFAVTSYAGREVPVSVLLTDLQIKKAPESFADELYFDVGIFRKGEAGRYVRIPSFPEHWSTWWGKNAGSATLWQGNLKSGDAVSLVVTLMEQDSSPFNTDDLVGAVQLKIKNRNGTIETQWSMPNAPAGAVSLPKSPGAAHQFVMTTSASRYVVKLKLKQGK